MSTVDVDRYTADGGRLRLRQAAASPRRPANRSIADQRQPLSRTGFRTIDLLETVEVVDGRLIVIHPGLRLAHDVSEHREPLARKYGGETEPVYRSRINMVLDYLETRQLELVKNGLARDGDPMAVREEFVRFLLNYKLDTRQEKIPQGAMRKFLDEWSHRWI